MISAIREWYVRWLKCILWEADSFHRQIMREAFAITE